MIRVYWLDARTSAMREWTNVCYATIERPPDVVSAMRAERAHQGEAARVHISTTGGSTDHNGSG